MSHIKPIFSFQYSTKGLRPAYSVLQLKVKKEILKLKKLNLRDALIY